LTVAPPPISYRVSSIDLVLLDPLVLALIVVAAVTTPLLLLYFKRRGRKVETWIWVIVVKDTIVFTILITVMLTGGFRDYGFWVVDGKLRVSTMGYYKLIDLCEARIELTSLDEVLENVSWRIYGVAIPGSKFVGIFKLEDGREAAMLALDGEDDAMIIYYGRRVIVISVPGVEDYYSKLVEYRSSVCR
jgi:hypothetical protein